MRVLGIILLLLALCQGALAVGISYEYLENNTLQLSPGETRYFKFIVQNEGDDEVTVNISVQSEIAKLIGGGIVTIPPKTYDSFVYFNITVPPAAVPGSRYAVGFTVGPGPERGDGQVPLAVSYDRSFSVLVAGEPVPAALEAPSDVTAVIQQRQRPQYLLWAGVILALILVCGLLWRRSSILASKAADASPAEMPVQQATTHIPVHHTAHTATPSIHAAQHHAVAPPQHTFRLAGGRQLWTLHDLLDAARAMDDATFSHHVTPHRNDFSTWVDEILQEHDLAVKLAAQRTRQQFVKVLEDALA